MQISPAKKEKLKANLGKREFVADLHPRYPKGHPKAGKFMPKGGTDYVNAVAKDTGKTPAQIQASLGSDSEVKTKAQTTAKTQTTAQKQSAPQGKRDYKDAFPSEVVKEIQASTKSLGEALSVQYNAEQAKLNAVKGTKREAGKAFTAAKKEVSAKQKAVEAVLIKHGASKERAREIAEKLIAKKVGQIKNSETTTKSVEKTSVKPTDKVVPEKVKTPQVKPPETKNTPKNNKENAFDGEDLSLADDPKKVIDLVSRITKTTPERARELSLAVDAFSSKHDTNIREAQRSGQSYNNVNFDPKTLTPVEDGTRSRKTDFDVVEAVNEFIDKAPKFKGQIYRGMRFKDLAALESALNQMGEGKVFSLDATSSFSASKAVATDFAKTDFAPYSMILHVDSNKSGVGIKRLSKYSEEEEVLVGAGASYRVKKIEKISRAESRDSKSNVLYNVYLEEVGAADIKSRREAQKKAAILNPPKAPLKDASDNYNDGYGGVSPKIGAIKPAFGGGSPSAMKAKMLAMKSKMAKKS